MSKQDVEKTGNIEQIREIIFGSQSREFQDQIDQLAQRLHESDAALNTRIDAMQKVLEAQLDKLSDILQDGQSDERSRFDRERERVDERIETLQAITEGELGDLRKELGASSSDLRDEMMQLHEAVKSSLDTEVASLEERKTSRDELSTLLFGIASRIKGDTPQTPQDEA